MNFIIYLSCQENLIDSVSYNSVEDTVLFVASGLWDFNQFVALLICRKGRFFNRVLLISAFKIFRFHIAFSYCCLKLLETTNVAYKTRLSRQTEHGIGVRNEGAKKSIPC